MNMELRDIVDVVEALIMLYASWYGYSYFSGRVKFTGEKEKRRIAQVEKYGVLLKVTIFITFICGLFLLIRVLRQ